MAEVALQVRTHAGVRLQGMDALSNEPPRDDELARFKVPLVAEEVRKKLRSLQRAFQQDAELFEEEELARRRENEERQELKRAEQARREEMERIERARREREREEVRRKAQARQAGETEQWWLVYQDKGGGTQREIAKVRSRLKRFEAIAKNSTAEGEKANADRLAEQARQKLAQLEAKLAGGDEQGDEQGDEEAAAAAEADEE